MYTSTIARYYSSEVTLFKKCVQTQLLIAPKSREVLEDVCNLLPTLRRYMSNDVGDSERAEIIRILQTFTKMCHLNDEDEPHPQNQKILYNCGKKYAVTNMSALIFKSHGPLGLLSVVLNYVLRISKVTGAMPSAEIVSDDSGDDEIKAKLPTVLRRTRLVTRGVNSQTAGIGLVCKACFRFLTALAKDNYEVKERY